jgi:hypothetical protein
MDNTIDFMEYFNNKNAEQNKDFIYKVMKMHLTIAVFDVELITGKDITNDKDAMINLARCYGIANDEFLADEECLDKYGGDEDTPSIQLFLINRLLSRTLELYFGESYQADKIKE